MGKCVKEFDIELHPEEINNIRRKILGRKKGEIVELLSKTYGVPKDKILEKGNEFLQQTIPKYTLMLGVKEFLEKF